MEDKPLHNNEFEGEEILRKHLKFKQTPLTTDKAALWNRIKSDIETEVPVRSIKSGSRKLYYIYAAAASIAVLLCFIFLFPGGMDTYEAPLAQQLELRLPDQSEVLVNAGSELRYNTKKWDKQRLVELDGEAFFKVSKGEKFTVATQQGEVQVLGTAFNVYARGAVFSVSCEEGRVVVRNNRGEEVVLESGDKVKLKNGQLEQEVVDLAKIGTWRSGLFEYESTGLTEIIAEIERQYDVKISIPENIEQEAMTLRFNTDQSLEDALEGIRFQYRLTIKIEGQKVTLE